MQRIPIFLLLFPFACFSQDKSGIVNMDTIQKYHPFTVQFKKNYLELTGKYTKTLKAHRHELDSFVKAHPKINSLPLNSAEWETFQSLQQRIADFETMAHKKLEEYQREQTDWFLAIFRKQLDEFIAAKKLSFIIDKSLLLYCAPCNDYTTEILEWIKKNTGSK